MPKENCIFPNPIEKGPPPKAPVPRLSGSGLWPVGLGGRSFFLGSLASEFEIYMSKNFILNNKTNILLLFLQN